MSTRDSNKELVSIVLTTLNAARFLRESVDSCLNQTYSNLELLAVDGGSTDGTVEILQSYTDPRMRLIHQTNNEGKLPGAINLGLEHASGDYLTWMQADSLYDPDTISKMVAALEAHPEVGQVYADYRVIDEGGLVLQIARTREPEEFLGNLGDSAGPCFMIRREVRETVGPHHIHAFPSQDYDYRMRIAMRFQSLHLHEPLYSWRTHGDSLSSYYSWADLARKDVAIRLDLGMDTPRESHKWAAEVEMAEAFDHYQSGRMKYVPRLVLSGLRLNPAFAANRGVWSILIKSLFSSKAKIQKAE